MTVGAAYWRPRRLEAEAESTSTTPAGSGEGGSGAEGGEGGEGAEGAGAEGWGEPPEGTASDGPFGSEGEPPPDDEPPPQDYDDPGAPYPPDYDEREGPPAQEPDPQQPSPIPQPPAQPRPRPQSPPAVGFASPQGMIEWSRGRARRALQEAIDTINSGLTMEERAILNRWFPGATTDQLRKIRSILQETRDALTSAPVRYVPSADTATDPDAPFHEAFLASGEPAAAIVQYPGPDHRMRPPDERYIAVYPPFVARPAYGATRILHEGFHYTDPENFQEHSGFFNASCFQALVSELTGLAFNVSVVSGECGM